MTPQTFQLTSEQALTRLSAWIRGLFLEPKCTHRGFSSSYLHEYPQNAAHHHSQYFYFYFFKNRAKT